MNTFAAIALLAFVCQASAFKLPGQTVNGNLHDECGISSKNSYGKPEYFVVGGQETETHEYPWVGALMYEDKQIDCTATLISDQWAVTVAHCVQGFPRLHSILFGAHNLNAWTETERRNIKVSEVIIHNKWDFPRNDIALLKLEHAVDFSEYIRPVCLPTRDDMNNVYQGTDATVVGWGMTLDNKVDGKEGLRAVEVTTLKHEEQVEYCDNKFPSVICTSTNKATKGFCFGDNGSPLMIKKSDGRWTAIGAASFILESCESGRPNGYTRLTANLEWIAEKTGIEIKEDVLRI